MARNCLYPTCFGAFLASALAACALMPSPALAEVCDKIVGEGWRPENGPSGLSIVPRAFLFLALIGIAVIAKRWWLSWALFGITGLVAVAGLLEDGRDSITQAGIREGCLVPSQWTDDVLFILATLAFALIAFRQSLSTKPRAKN